MASTHRLFGRPFPCALLVSAALLACQVHAQSTQAQDEISLLGTSASTASAPVQDDACAGGQDPARLKEILQEGGQKTALIIRGGKFGIHPQVLDIIRRVADAWSGDPAIQSLLREHLTRAYISDDQEVKQRLRAAGYKVEARTSLDYAGRLDQFKTDVLDVLRRPETSLVVFYGHGSTDRAWLTHDREDNVPGLAELLRRKEDIQPDQFLTVEDFQSAAGGKGLDALIMHGCQEGTNAYLQSIGKYAGTTFADAVKKDTGFFAGWVTYSVYLHPDTGRILDRYFCRRMAMAAGPPAGGAGALATGRYFVRAAGIARSLAILGLGSDGSGLAEADLAADPTVHPHTMEYIGSAEPVAIAVDLLTDLKLGHASLAADLRRFIVRYANYCRRQGIPMDQPGRGSPPALADAPSIEDLNALLAYHGAPILAQAFDAIAPGLIDLKEQAIALEKDDPDRVSLSLTLDVKKATDVETALGLLTRLGRAPIEEGLEVGTGSWIGPQLAPRVRDTLAAATRALDETLASLSIDLGLEKVIREDGNAIRPVVYGYDLALGDVPASVRADRAAPYQIHVSTSTLERVARRSAQELFSSEVMVYASRLVDLYVHMSSFDGLTRRDGALRLAMTWEVRGDWLITGNGYGTIDVAVDLGAAPAGDLKLDLSPAVQVTFGRGWPFPGWVGGLIGKWVSGRVTDSLRARVGTIDLAQAIPESARAQVAGQVAIDQIEMGERAVTVRFRRVSSAPMP